MPLGFLSLPCKAFTFPFTIDNFRSNLTQDRLHFLASSLPLCLFYLQSLFSDGFIANLFKRFCDSMLGI